MYYSQSDIDNILSNPDDDHNPFDGDDYGFSILDALMAGARLQAESIIRLHRLLIIKGVISKEESIECIFKYGRIDENEIGATK